MQFNDVFEIFILCFSVSHGAIEHLISFLLFHISMCITQRVGGRAREIQGWAKLVLIALERYSVELKRLTFNLR